METMERASTDPELVGYTDRLGRAEAILSRWNREEPRIRRLRVSDDVSVVGLHDFPLAEFIEPPLTTVAMPLREFGAAAEMVLGRIDPEPGTGSMLHVPPQLVVRASSGPPPP